MSGRHKVPFLIPVQFTDMFSFVVLQCGNDDPEIGWETGGWREVEGVPCLEITVESTDDVIRELMDLVDQFQERMHDYMRLEGVGDLWMRLMPRWRLWESLGRRSSLRSEE